MAGNLEDHPFAGLNNTSRLRHSIYRMQRSFTSRWRRRASVMRDLESQNVNPIFPQDTQSSSTSATPAAHTSATPVTNTSATPAANTSPTPVDANESDIVEPEISAAVAGATNHRPVASINAEFLIAEATTSSSASAADVSTATTGSSSETLSAGTASTAVTSISSPPPSAHTMPIFQLQGLFLQPHVDAALQKVYTNELKPRIRAQLARKCRRNTWILEFSLAGIRYEWLLPSILVWCDDRDTKIRVRNYLSQDSWLTERLHFHGVSHYVLDKAPRRTSRPIDQHRRVLHGMKGSLLSVPDQVTTSCGLDLVFSNGTTSKIGGLISVDAVPYLLATRHALDETSKEMSSSSVEDKGFARTSSSICAQNSSSHSSGDVDSTSPAYPSLRTTTTASLPNYPTGLLQCSSEKEVENWPVTVMYPPLLDAETALLDHSNDFDWLLVDLSDAPNTLLDKVLKPNLFQQEHIQEMHVGVIGGCSVVTVATANEPLPGFLSSTYSTLHVDDSLYEVMLITLEKPLPPGTSGTWVIHRKKVCGFVIAARDDLPWAYMIPMQDAFDDMKKWLKTNSVNIPNLAQVDMLRSGESWRSRDCGLPNSPDQNHNAEAKTSLSVTASSPIGRMHRRTSSIDLWEVEVQHASFTKESELTEFDPRPTWNSNAKRIREDIHRHMETNFEGRSFIPSRYLEEIFQDNTIAALINEDESLNRLLLPSQIPNTYPQDTKQSFAKKVARFATRLLALCIYVDMELACLHSMIRNGLDDFSLPLLADHCPSERYRVKWEIMTTIQGGFFVHNISIPHELEHHYFDSDIVVPIAFDKSRDFIGEGSSGRVFRVHLDPGRERYARILALKVYFQQGSRTETAFDNEIRALKRLSSHLHDHITPVLASWTQNETFYQLMPLARGNFKQFLKTSPSPCGSLERLSWFVGQMRGLADGLCKIHEMRFHHLTASEKSSRDPVVSQRTHTGYHHDLKPDNILVFDSSSLDEPVLKISDFGLARFGLTISESGIGSESYFTENSGQLFAPYGAPEVYQQGRASRPYDIWSFGCILLDTIIWWTGIPDFDPDSFALQRLQNIPNAKGRQNKSFWYITSHGNVLLKPVIIKLLANLAETWAGNAISTRIIDLTKQLLSIDPSHRPSSFALFSELDGILQKVHMPTADDQNYFYLRRGKGSNSGESHQTQLLPRSGYEVPSPSDRYFPTDLSIPTSKAHSKNKFDLHSSQLGSEGGMILSSINVSAEAEKKMSSESTSDNNQHITAKRAVDPVYERFHAATPGISDRDISDNVRSQILQLISFRENFERQDYIQEVHPETFKWLREDSVESAAEISTRTSMSQLSRVWKQSTDDDDGTAELEEFSIAPMINCRVLVWMRDTLLESPESFEISWLAEGQYDDIKKKIVMSIKRYLDREYDNGKMPKVYRTSAEVRLYKKGADQPEETESVLHRGHWAQKVPVLVAKYGSENPFCPLVLEVVWHYDMVDIHGHIGNTLAEKVLRMVHEKLIQNWREEMFLPTADLDAIFSMEIIRELMNDDQSLLQQPLPHDPRRTEEDIDRWKPEWLHLNASVLFATTIYASVPLAYLRQLVVDHKMKDTNLPLRKVPPGVNSVFFDKLTQNQSHFCVYKFDAAKLKRMMERGKYAEIEYEETVPITMIKPLGEGAYGMVYEASILEGHHTFKEDTFALKELRQGAYSSAVSGAFANETNVFSSLMVINHPNILVPLAMWRKKDRRQSGRDEFYMIYSKAHCNLAEYLRTFEIPPRRDRKFMEDLLLQLKNLAEALAQIHRLPKGFLDAQEPPSSSSHLSHEPSTGMTHLGLPRAQVTQYRTAAHHDLKPENILIFGDGTWKISDFGTADVTEAVSGQSVLQMTNLKDGGPVYRPPEWDTQQKTAKAYDIWCFGCILLEILLTLFHETSSNEMQATPQHHRLDAFWADRANCPTQHDSGAYFWYKTRGGDGNIHYYHQPPVQERFEMLHRQTKEYDQMENLVKLAEDMMTINPKERPRAAQVSDSIKGIYDQVRFNLNNNEDFYLIPNSIPLFKGASIPTTDGGTYRPIDRSSHDHSTALTRLLPLPQNLRTRRYSEADSNLARLEIAGGPGFTPPSNDLIAVEQTPTSQAVHIQSADDSTHLYADKISLGSNEGPAASGGENNGEDLAIQDS